jgi:hypothetical protein
MKPPRHRSEKAIQRDVVGLYRSVGARVWDTSQPFRALITPGMPDLWVVIRIRRGYHRGGKVKLSHGFWHETKRPGAKLSAAQERFKKEAAACGLDVVVGGVSEGVAYLQEHGILEKTA